MSFKEIAAAFAKEGNKEGSGSTAAWAARDKSGHLSPFSFDRRPVGAEDIKIQITYAGICHSDLHQLKVSQPSQSRHQHTCFDRACELGAWP